jgi:hypothetical protein
LVLDMDRAAVLKLSVQINLGCTSPASIEI